MSGARAFDADGNYLTFVPTMQSPVAKPAAPVRLDSLPNGPKAGWYMQALGHPAMRGTSAWTGQDARLFIGEHSRLGLRFAERPATVPGG